MSRQDTAEVTFHDASAYFPEEEWKLLHEWQKELYRNVMKEIQQALLSLGPIITTTVISLRAKEKEQMIQMDNQDSQRRNGMNYCATSDLISSPDTLLSVKREEPFNLNNASDTEEKDAEDCFSTGGSFPRDVCLKKEEDRNSIFMDQLGAENGQTSPDLEIFRMSEMSGQVKAKMTVPVSTRYSTSPPSLHAHPLSQTGPLPPEDLAVSPPPRLSAFRTHSPAPTGSYALLRTLSSASIPRRGTFAFSHIRPGRGRGRKAPPFTMGEMRALVLGITPHYRQLYHTGAASNAVKRELWQQIRHCVASEGIVMRTVGQLKIKYRQMRRPVIQKLSLHRTSLTKQGITDSISSPNSLGLSDMEHLIASSVVPETIEGVSDNPSDDPAFPLEDAPDHDMLTDTDDSEDVEGDGSDYGEAVEEYTQLPRTEDLSVCFPSAVKSTAGRLLTSAQTESFRIGREWPHFSTTRLIPGAGESPVQCITDGRDLDCLHCSPERVHITSIQDQQTRDVTYRVDAHH